MVVEFAGRKVCHYLSPVIGKPCDHGFIPVFRVPGVGIHDPILYFVVGRTDFQAETRLEDQ